MECSVKDCQTEASHEADDKPVCGECGSKLKRAGAYVRLAHPEEAQQPSEAKELDNDNGT